MYVRAYAQIQQPIIGVSYLNSLEWDVKQQTLRPVFRVVISMYVSFLSYYILDILHFLPLYVLNSFIQVSSLHFVLFCVYQGMPPSTPSDFVQSWRTCLPPLCPILCRYDSLHMSYFVQVCLLPLNVLYCVGILHFILFCVGRYAILHSVLFCEEGGIPTMQLQVCLHFVQCCVGIPTPFCTILCRYASLHFVLSQCRSRNASYHFECFYAFKYYVEGTGMLQLQIINNRKKCNETIQKS